MSTDKEEEQNNDPTKSMSGSCESPPPYSDRDDETEVKSSDLSVASPVAKKKEKKDKRGNIIENEGPCGANSAHNDTDVEIDEDAVNLQRKIDELFASNEIFQPSSSSSNSGVVESAVQQTLTSPTKKQKLDKD